VCHLEEVTCHEALNRLIEVIARVNHSFAIDRVYEQILRRDSCGIALAAPEVAVVHVRVEGLERFQIAMGTSRQGPRCGISLEGANCPVAGSQTVKLLVIILARLDDPAGYLRAVAALSRACRREGFVDRLVSLNDPEQIWKAFEAANEHLPAYVKAGDIMQEAFAHLHGTDSLSDAIDAFCRLGVSELPVVDKDGDLLGIVSEDELIRVCLPEYITWMEDLSPILNFEPFAEVLRRESSVPVVEIMQFSEHYAHWARLLSYRSERACCLSVEPLGWSPSTTGLSFC
jgi:CBS domain-containing protein